jgi:uncharacterized membrane protein
MVLLILGVLVWSAAHLVPSLGAQMRAGLIGRIGEGPYKGLFALTIVGSIVLMVVGWRSSSPVVIYQPPGWGTGFAQIGMLITLVLFIGSNLPSNLKRMLRHPQLTGVAIWALSHLVANGDQRSLVLFGGIGIWAVVAMLSINRRDGEWEKPAPLAPMAYVKPVVAGVVAYVLLALAHPYIAGVSALPG